MADDTDDTNDPNRTVKLAVVFVVGIMLLVALLVCVDELNSWLDDFFGPPPIHFRPSDTPTTDLLATPTFPIFLPTPFILVPTETTGIQPSPTSGTPTLTPTPVDATATATPDPAPASQRPVVTGFTALFVQVLRTTKYSVTASDPAGGKLTYAWSNSNKCGSFSGGHASTTDWYHPDVPGGCPKEDVHPGIITVVISNDAGTVTCQYSGGSASGSTVQCTNSQ